MSACGVRKEYKKSRFRSNFFESTRATKIHRKFTLKISKNVDHEVPCELETFSSNSTMIYSSRLPRQYSRHSVIQKCEKRKDNPDSVCAMKGAN